MEEKTTKRPRRVMVSEGKLLIMQEVPFKEGTPRRTIRFFGAFNGNAANLVEIALKKRIEKCVASLTRNVGNATRVTDIVVEWENGCFSLPAYNSMEEALEILGRDNLTEMTRYSAIQILKALLDVRYIDIQKELSPLEKEDYAKIKEYIFNVFCEIALTADK